jgi:hypothetical protein
MIYLLRLLSLPFFTGLLVIAFTWQVVLKSYLWLRYGGEAVNYNDKMNGKSITQVFYEVQKRL